MSVLIYGCGYLGWPAARRWRSAGLEVHVATRSPQRAEQLEGEGIHAHLVDILDPPANWRPPSTETTLFSLGFDGAPNQSLTEVYVNGLRNAFQAAREQATKWIYISTTGVYGESGGGPALDEQAPCEPRREGGHASLQCERFLQREAESGCWILRMAGLYGPGRVPRRDDLVLGIPLAALPDSRLNLIHVQDAAGVVVQASQMAPSGCEIVNICDGHPVRRRDFYNEAARLLDVPPPQFVAPQGEGRASSTGKTIDCRKRARLFPEPLEFPSYRQGLSDALER